MKIETKHGLWKVKVEMGEYSDHCEEVIVIAANSAEETWNKVKWLYDNYELPMRDDKPGKTYPKRDGTTWVDETGDSRYYLLSEEFGNYGENKEDSDYYGLTITISPLDIYYFNGKEE